LAAVKLKNAALTVVHCIYGHVLLHIVVCHHALIGPVLSAIDVDAAAIPQEPHDIADAVVGDRVVTHALWKDSAPAWRVCVLCCVVCVCERRGEEEPSAHPGALRTHPTPG